MGVVVGAIALGGLALSVYSQVQAGKQAKMAGKLQSQIAQNNKRLAERAALQVEEDVEVDVFRRGQITKQDIADFRTSSAARGVEVGSGSSAAVQASIAEAGHQDILTILENADREAQALRETGANFDQQAHLAQVSASNDQSARNVQAVSTALSGLGTVASSWYQYSGSSGSANSSGN